MATGTAVCYEDREFDIILFSTGSIPSSVIREFEDLPLRIALCVGAPAEEGPCASRDASTMLQIIDNTDKEMHLLTSRTRLLVNVSAYTVSTVISVVEACVSTGTTYIDGCTDPAVLGEVQKCFGGQHRIKIVPGCAGVPFLVDLCVFYVVRGHNIRGVECTIKPPTDFYRRITMCSRLMPPFITSFRYKLKPGCYEVPAVSTIGQMLGRSRRYFIRKGMPFTVTSVYVSVGSVVMLALCLMASWFSTLLRAGKWSRGSACSMTGDMELKFVGTMIEDSRTVKLRVTTPICDVSALCLAQAAISIIENTDSGGVLTPAMALHRTKVIERLAHRGVVFHHIFK